MIAAKTADHVKHGDGDAAQNEGRVARERRLESADRIPGQAVVIGEGAIERRRRLARAGERQALLGFGHRGFLPLDERGRHANIARADRARNSL